jgi:hypothetical protein
MLRANCVTPKDKRLLRFSIFRFHINPLSALEHNVELICLIAQNYPLR